MIVMAIAAALQLSSEENHQGLDASLDERLARQTDRIALVRAAVCRERCRQCQSTGPRGCSGEAASFLGVYHAAISGQRQAASNCGAFADRAIAKAPPSRRSTF